MRMDRRSSISAKEIVNQYTERELFRIIRDYGEEQFAQNIAKHWLFPVTTMRHLQNLTILQ